MSARAPGWTSNGRSVMALKHAAIFTFERTLIGVIWFASLVSAWSQLLVRDGPVSDTSMIGYSGCTYQAVRYEPLCGTLGTDSRFQRPITMTENCTPAMDVFSNNTHDLLAFYDITGVRLKNAVLGGGTALCMCFSLAQLAANGLKSDICIYVDGTAQSPVYWSISTDNFLAANYRPGSFKSLPQCAIVDLDALKASWSATAVQPSVTEVVKTLPNVGAGSGNTKTVVSTFTPSGKHTHLHSTCFFSPKSLCGCLTSYLVVNYTLITTFTTMNSQGSLTTQTTTSVTQLPVVTSTSSSSSGLSLGDKIALGVGLGIGLPTIILMVIGLMRRRHHV